MSDEYGLINQIKFQGRSFAANDVSGYKKVQPDDIVYTRSPLALKPYGIIKKSFSEAGIISPLYIVNTVKEGNDSTFLYYNFDSPEKTNNYLKPLVRMGAKHTMNISNDEWLSGEIWITSEEEQKKIGKFFRLFDNALTLHQRKLESMKLLKKSLLQKMFPKSGETVPEVRFPGFTDAWEQRKFEDIAKRRSDSTISSRSLPCVEYEDVISEQGTLNKDISQKENAKTGIVFESGDVLFGKLRPYLKNWLLPDFNGVAVGDWWILKPVSIDGNFLYRLIQTNEFMSVANVSSGSKMPRSDWALVSKTYFSVPPDISEQRKIGTFFRDIDHTITLHQRKVEILHKLKKSLLQQMFV